MAARAKEFYSLARRTLPEADQRSMIAAEGMGKVYWRRLLLQIGVRTRFNVFGARPIRLSKAHKLIIMAGAWSRLAFWRRPRLITGRPDFNYGFSPRAMRASMASITGMRSATESTR